MVKEKKNLVVGAGLSGAVIAQQIASSLDEEVLIIDKKEHIAGNCFDYVDKNGICIHKYGSHIFHTNYEDVWDYLSKFCSFNKYTHEVFVDLDGKKTTIPFNLKSLYDIFPKKLAETLEQKLCERFKDGAKISILDFQSQEDEDLKFLAKFVYDKVFVNYTCKQWGTTPELIDQSVTARVPVYISRDNRYFQDKYQGIPIGGYSKLVENILKHPNIELKLNTEFKDVSAQEFDRIFYTGSIDEFFDYKYGILPYRSVKFKLEECDVEFYQENSVVNYPNEHDYTRIHEYKYYLNDKSDKTVIAKEYSEAFEIGKNERIYPIPKQENDDLYQKYLNEAKAFKNIYFLGRLGDYKYYNMDLAVKRALDVCNSLA